MKVSVIVPCYNQGEFLQECLESVFASTYSDWECIIVNDGSFDNTETVAEVFVNKDGRFKYIYQNNQGVSAARNNGILASHGDLILPLDGDDKISPYYMEKAIKVFENAPDTKLVYCLCEKFGRKKGLYKLPDYHYNSLIWGNLIFCSAFYKREDFDKTMGYNVNMKNGLEDWDFWLSLLDSAAKVYRINEVLFYYRSKADSRGHGSVKHMDDLLIQVYKNHKELYEPYVERMIINHNNLLRLSGVEKENETIKCSLAYKLGVLMTTPIRFLKKNIKR